MRAIGVICTVSLLKEKDLHNSTSDHFVSAFYGGIAALPAWVKGMDEHGHVPSDIEQTTIAYKDMQSALAEFSADNVKETMEELQPSSVLTENPINCPFT